MNVSKDEVGLGLLPEELRKAGYDSPLNLIKAPPDVVGRRCNMKKWEVLAIKRAVLRGYNTFKTRSDEIYKEMHLYSAVFPTGIESLDRILGGGLFIGEIVELVGPSKSGKTQICFSVASYMVSVAQQRVLYVDSNSSFSAKRVKSILESHGITDKELRLALSRITWCPCFELEDLIAMLDNCYTQFTKSEDTQPVKLIVIDSIAPLILPRLVGPNMEGFGLLNRIGTKLKSLANEKELAILITNSVVQWKNDEPRPNLGLYWSHVPNVQLLLTLEDGSNENRIASVSRSKTVAIGRQAKYQLTTSGVEAGLS